MEKVKNYLKEFGLDCVVLGNTKYLMQSVNLTYARYEFLKDKNIIVNNDNYNLLFIGNNDFRKKFKIEKTELLEKYSYKNREERRNKI